MMPDVKFKCLDCGEEWSELVIAGQEDEVNIRCMCGSKRVIPV